MPGNALKRGGLACLAALVCLALVQAVFRLCREPTAKRRVSQVSGGTALNNFAAASFVENIGTPPRVRDACVALETNDLIGAENILRSAAATYPNSEDTQLALGVLLLQTGRGEEAESQLRRAAKIMTERKKTDDAAMVGRATEDSAARGRLVEYLRQKASTYRHSGDCARTEFMARLCIVLAPDDAYSWDNLGWALEGLERYDQMERACRKSVELAPNSARALDGLGSALFYMGSYGEAEECLRKAVKLDPSFPEAQNDLGGLLARIGQLDEAEAHFRDAIRLKPSFGASHSGLGAILFLRGQSKEAEAEFREAVRLDNSFRTHDALGFFLMSVNRLDEAHKEFQEALRLQPGSPEVACNLGMLFWKKGKLLEAESQYREAVRVARGYSRASDELAFFLLAGKGKRQVDEKKFHEAEETYREVIRLSTNYAFAYNNLGYLLIADPNRWDEAEALIQKSLNCARAEEKPVCWDSLGELLAKQPHRQIEAVAAYREALAGFSAADNTNEVNRIRDILNHLETQQ